MALGQYYLDYAAGVNNKDIVLYYNAVPEPSTWALLVGTLAVMAVFRRRRA